LAHTETGGALPDRSDLDPRYTWDLDALCPSLEEFEKRFATVEARLDDLSAYRGRLGESAADLLHGLRLRDELLMDVERLGTWASLRASENANNAVYVALEDRTAGLLSRGESMASFFEPEIIELGADAIPRFIAEDTSGGLAEYGHYLDNLFRRQANVRSAEIETVLASAGEALGAFESTFNSLVDADLRFAPFEDEAGHAVTFQQNGQHRYLTSTDRRVRQAAYECYFDAYLAMRHTLAANYAGEVKKNVFFARARGYDSALAAALDDTNMPAAIYHNLLDAFDRNVGLWQRFFRVQARLLGVERLRSWDVSEMPLPLPGRVRKEYSYEDGVEIVLRSLTPLGEEYVGIVRRGIADRWIDVHSNVGKRGGAFSGGAPGTYPYILLNWQGGLAAVSVLTHELGHSLHSYYAWQTQPLVYAWYGDVVSETASNLHQVLLADYLLRNSNDPDEQIAVIQERMGSHLRYLFNMILLAKFELDCHQRVERGEALTADSMIATMADLYGTAYGDSVDFDAERTGIRWATFSHLFLNFYPWTYGAGTAAAVAIGSQIIRDGAPAAGRYLDMLRAGDSIDEYEAIRRGGADLADPAIIQSAFDVLTGYVDRLEALAG
jgi:oligoendopeptidase F